MQRTNFGEMACSIACTLDVIGEPWSPLILRDVWVGMNRFDPIQADLGISRKVLTERLNYLVERGVLDRRPYDRRPRSTWRSRNEIKVAAKRHKNHKIIFVTFMPFCGYFLSPSALSYRRQIFLQ